MRYKISLEKDSTIMNALGNQICRDILLLLANNTLNVNQISRALNLPQSTTTVNIKKLDEASLIEIIKGEGNKKLCRAKYHTLEISMICEDDSEEEAIYRQTMPVGLYTAILAIPQCGLTSHERQIGMMDDPRAFHLAERINAQLLWFSHGYVEYSFFNPIMSNDFVDRMMLTAEMCSEAPFYKENFPSDITCWINGIEVGTWTSPGDPGGRRGNYTPTWWPAEHTQYGFLKTWVVNHSGSYVDGVQISDTTLLDLQLLDKKNILIKWGIRDTANNQGGLNLLGKQFGNYDQDIQMTIYYSKK